MGSGRVPLGRLVSWVGIEFVVALSPFLPLMDASLGGYAVCLSVCTQYAVLQGRKMMV